MKLDRQGVLVPCSGCGTTNRLRYTGLNRPVRCAKCHGPMPAPPSPIDVPDAAVFDRAVAESPIPIVVDFWAAWCGPCRMVAPEVQKVAQRLAGRALVLKVDTEAIPDLADRFRVRSIPTIGIFRDGREVTRAAGVQSAEAIEALIGTTIA